MDQGLVFVLVILVIAGVGTVLVARAMQTLRRARRLLSRAAEKRLGAIVEGDRVRVRGVARRPQYELTAPFSGRRCIGFCAVVETFDGENDWKESFRQEECLPFELAADGIEARVEGPFLLGLEIDLRGDDPEQLPAVLEAFQRLGIETTNVWHRALRLRYREAILEHDDPIWMLGRASIAVDQHGQRETPRGQPVKRTFRGTKRELTVIADDDQPGVLAPFA